MKSSLRSRLQKLEAQRLAPKGEVHRFGLLFPLPDDYVGERHVVGSCMPTHIPNQLWCIFREMPGPGPNAAEGASITRMLPGDEDL
jgi:hypothetical protein